MAIMFVMMLAAADLNMDDLQKFTNRFNQKVDVCARYGMHRIVLNGRVMCSGSKQYGA